jgi:hypothetical protein
MILRTSIVFGFLNMITLFVAFFLPHVCAIFLPITSRAALFNLQQTQSLVDETSHPAPGTEGETKQAYSLPWKLIRLLLSRECISLVITCCAILYTFFIQDARRHVQPAVGLILNLVSKAALNTAKWIGGHEGALKTINREKLIAQDQITFLALILQRHEAVEEAIRDELRSIKEKLAIQEEISAENTLLNTKTEIFQANIEDVKIAINEMGTMLKSMDGRMDLLCDGMETLVKNELRRSQSSSYSSAYDSKSQLQLEYYDVKPDEWLEM